VTEIKKLIKESQEKIFSGIGITSDDVEKLFNIPDEYVKELAKAANEVTRDFNGKKVDIEQLNNIKKNECSENCSFCGQSAFFNTWIETYQLPATEKIVTRAIKAKNEGAES